MIVKVQILTSFDGKMFNIHWSVQCQFQFWPTFMMYNSNYVQFCQFKIFQKPFWRIYMIQNSVFFQFCTFKVVKISRFTNFWGRKLRFWLNLSLMILNYQKFCQKDFGKCIDKWIKQTTLSIFGRRNSFPPWPSG